MPDLPLLSRLLARPVSVAAWAVALVLAGAWAAAQLPLEWTPRVELPVVNVSASWAGGSPRAVERLVTAPIERAVQRVPGTASVESTSSEGRAFLRLEVSAGTDLARYTAAVGEQLALLRGTLPDGVYPVLTKQVPESLRDEQGFLRLQLIGSLAPDALRRLADEQIAPKLRSLPAVADVVVHGGRQREVLVTLDPDRLARYGLTPNDVQRPLYEAATDRVFGRLREGHRATLLYSPAVGRTDALRTLIVRPSRLRPDGTLTPPVRLTDVARVERGPAPLESTSRIDGEPVVTLEVDRARGSHLLRTAGLVQRRLEELRADLPSGVRLLIAEDRSEDVRAQVDDLARQGGLGLLLVVLALVFMLKSLRATALVLSSVACAFAVAFLLMLAFGLTLNLITLAGLVLVFGLLVDNGVVVTEQLLHRRPGEAYAHTVRQALGAVWLPLLGGTLSTIAVMLPLVYLSGDLRALFLPFGVLTALTLAASLVAAGVVVPALGRYLPTHETAYRPRRLRRAVAAPYRVATRFPRTTLLALVLMLGLPVWLLPDAIQQSDDASRSVVRLAELYNRTLGAPAVLDVRRHLDKAVGGVTRPFFRETSFGQPWRPPYRPTVGVRMAFPPGTPVERADALIGVFEKEALASGVAERTVVTATERSASLMVYFSADELQTARPYVLREQLIGRAVDLAGVGVSVYGLLPEGYYSGYGMMNQSGLRIAAYGPSYEDLATLAERFARRLKSRSARVAEVDINAGRWGGAEKREVLRFRWTADAQARTGEAAAALAGRLRPTLSTRYPLFYADLDAQPRMPVRLIVDGADATDVDRLAQQPLTLGDSTVVRLAGLADYRVEETPGQIEREDQQYRRYINVDYRGPYRMGSEFLTRELEAFALPAGYRFERQSGFFTEETTRAFGWVLLGALALIYLVCAAVFESWRLPWLVLTSVPLALVGVALGFLATDAAFAEGAFIGSVLLAGIAVNDAILLVDRYRQLRTAAPHRARAVLARLAVRHRLRPMWTTTLTSCAALVPLLALPGEGEAFWKGLAVCVTGGLLAATLLAPLAVLAVVSLFAKRRA